MFNLGTLYTSVKLSDSVERRQWSRISRRCLSMSRVHAVDLISDKDLETFIGESPETIKKVPGRYADNMA